jgi:photosystem II stability/assembly factor-like uncharacterized protein
MKRFIFFLLFFFTAHIFAQPKNKWELSANIPEDSIVQAQLFFSDDLHGYLYGYKPAYFLSQRTYKDLILYRTLDGGKTWNKLNFHEIFKGDTTLYDYHYFHYDFILTFHISRASSLCYIENADANDFQQNEDTLIFYRSTDYGSTWNTVRTNPPLKRITYMIEGTDYNKKIIALKFDGFGYSRDGSNGKFSYSDDGGKTFKDSRWDSTLLKNLSDGGFGSEGVFNMVNSHYFDFSNDSTWVIIVSDTNNSGSMDSTKPYILTTLISKDQGYHWNAYHNSIPNFPSDVGAQYFGAMQCVYGTPYIYLFVGNSPEGGIAFTHSPGVSGFPDHGINYIYSSDFGQTWNIDTSYNKNRRGYEATAPNEVWCTVTRRDSVNNITPTSWIIHTTDNGKKWDIDSTSLFNDIYYDSRVITFSDKNHGWIYAQPTDRKSIAIFKYTAEDNGVNVHWLFKTAVNYKIYPNPSSSIAIIQFTDNTFISSLEISDIIGRKLLPFYEISTSKSSVLIHTSGLMSGCFIAHLITTNGSYTIPFIVQE